MTLVVKLGPGEVGSGQDHDEVLCMRLRDLALVDLDAFVAGVDPVRAAELVSGYADDVAYALREARTRIAALRATFGGADPLNVVETTPRQRASDSATAAADRVRTRLTDQAEAARALARLAEMAGSLIPKLFEADRRR